MSSAVDGGPRARCAMITGASAGIGEAFARSYAKRGHDLVLVARRSERLEALAAALIARHAINVQVVQADLAKASAVELIGEAIAQNDAKVDVLVNNAGSFWPRFETVGISEHRALIELMLVTPIALMHHVLPAMRERGYGRIINVASFAGFLPGGPNGGLYRAAKSALIRASETVWSPKATDDIRVTALCPGYVLSEFHDPLPAGEMRPDAPGLIWLDADFVANAGIEAVNANRRVVVTGIAYKIAAVLLKLAPFALIARLEAPS